MDLTPVDIVGKRCYHFIHAEDVEGIRHSHLDCKYALAWSTVLAWQLLFTVVYCVPFARQASFRLLGVRTADAVGGSGNLGLARWTSAEHAFVARRMWGCAADMLKPQLIATKDVPRTA